MNRKNRLALLLFLGMVFALSEPAVAVGGGGGGPCGGICGGPVAAPGTSGDVSPDPSTFYAGQYNHVFLLGTGTNALLPGGLLSSSEAWNIDTKLDDGKPDTGAVTTLESQGSSVAGSGCGNQDGDTAAIPASSYDLTNEQKACSLVIKTGY